MNDSSPHIDATTFMGMHHADARVRQLSLGFFRSQAQRPVLMNFEQIGICDAVVWRQARDVQDAYYPFMDVLHSQMPIQRSGYTERVLSVAGTEPALRGLRTDRALLAAQVLCSERPLLTHDPVLSSLRCLQPFLLTFDGFDAQARFDSRLESLYELSRKLSFTAEDWPC